MPYIVTTKKLERGYAPRGSATYAQTVARRAVATLDEARQAMARGVHDYALSAESTDGLRGKFDTAHSLPEQGGTVTLPDGTVIEVERVTEDYLLSNGVRQSYSSKNIIESYNEAQTC